MANGKQLESELKYELTPSGYRRLLALARPYIQKRKRFTNFYFDDASLSLKDRGVGVRLRLDGGSSAILTVKTPPPQRSRGPRALFVRQEFESTIALSRCKPHLVGHRAITSLDSPPLRKLKRLFPEVSELDIKRLGTMKMQRAAAAFPEGFTIEIDRYEVFGKTFHEVELETEDAKRADRWIRSLLRKNKITFRPTRISKLARFLMAWKKEKRR